MLCKMKLAAAVAGVAMSAIPVLGFDVAQIDFETSPALSAGPSVFSSAGPAQTIDVPGIATLTGGVVLGNATNFPGIVYATGPNTYATAGGSLPPGSADPTLSATLTIDFDAGFTVNRVNGALFNGATSAQTYNVQAFAGDMLLETQTYDNIPPTLSSGYQLFDLQDAGITQVTITPANTTPYWDFAVDTIAINQPIDAIINPPVTPSVVPLPPALPAGLAVLGGMGLMGMIRGRRVAT